MLVPLHRTMTDSFAVSWSIHDYANAIASHSGILEAIQGGDRAKQTRTVNCSTITSCRFVA